MKHAAYLPVYGRPAADGAVTLLALKPWAAQEPASPFSTPDKSPPTQLPDKGEPQHQNNDRTKE